MSGGKSGSDTAGEPANGQAASQEPVVDPAAQTSLTYRLGILLFVMLGTTIYTASILISSTLLPKMQGALAATADEISWTMTFNIVATAVATPMTGWLSERLGRRNTMVWCSAVFALSTFFCGMSTTLEELIFWRIVQGAAGAPLVPLGQTILLDTFPRSQHNTVIAIYGMANMIGPVLGPTIGGEISEAYGWRWGFWMVVPVAIITAVGWQFIMKGDPERERPTLDWTGFLSLSIAIAGAQLVMSRGQRLDWFESNEIVAATFLTGVVFYLFLAHSLTTDRPFIRLHLMRDRNYAIGLILVLLFGMLNFAPIVLLPPLLQQQANFPDTTIGALIGYRGIGSAIGFFLAMVLGRFDPRAVMFVACILQALSGAYFIGFSLNINQTEMAIALGVQGLSVGLCWVPMTVMTFWTLDPKYRAEGMSMFHLLRNFGSSLFISIAVAEIVRTTSANYARLTEHASEFHRAWSLPASAGAYAMETPAQMAQFGREITRQATLIGYTNAFVMFTVVAALMVPLVLMAKMPKTSTG
ncbi:MAG: DHA2 family efflux MFS transporter permease subunit [Pseudomonadota bacterium]